MDFINQYKGKEETEFNFDMAQLSLIFDVKAKASESLSERYLNNLDEIYNRIRDYWKECDPIMSAVESEAFKDRINEIEELRVYYNNEGSSYIGDILYCELEKLYLEISLMLKNKGIFLREKKGRKELARELN